MWLGSSSPTLRLDMFFAFHSLSWPLKFCSPRADSIISQAHKIFLLCYSSKEGPCGANRVTPCARGEGQPDQRPDLEPQDTSWPWQPTQHFQCLQENEKTPLLPPTWLLLSRGRRDKKDFPEIQPVIFIWVFIRSFMHFFSKPIFTQHSYCQALQ